ncbi:hypothetical protein Plhal304r1_c035g0108051 [Plasmopara halstedii]
MIYFHIFFTFDKDIASSSNLSNSSWVHKQQYVDIDKNKSETLVQLSSRELLCSGVFALTEIYTNDNILSRHHTRRLSSRGVCLSALRGISALRTYRLKETLTDVRYIASAETTALFSSHDTPLFSVADNIALYVSIETRTPTPNWMLRSGR